MLRSDVPGSLRSLVMVQNGTRALAGVEHSLTRCAHGGTQVRKALGADLFEYFAQPENAEEAALFAAPWRLVWSGYPGRAGGPRRHRCEPRGRRRRALRAIRAAV